MRTLRSAAASLLCLALGPPIGAGLGERRSAPTLPQEFVIGRHSFVDFGPPFDFYEIFSVRSTPEGSSIERVTLTPAADPCFRPASSEFATASVPDSVPSLLGSRNPCSISEKALGKERGRCKHCLVFSGVNVAMQVRCGNQVRRIRMKVLDHDLYDAAARTPEHTSWSMGVLGRLDEAIGPGALDRPVFLPPEPPAAGRDTPSSLGDEIARGALDDLLGKTPDALSELYAEARKAPRRPIVELRTSSGFRPVSGPDVKYPDIAIVARVHGDVPFSLTVTSEGSVTDLKLLGGPPLLQRAVEDRVLQWRFSPGAAGQLFTGVISFNKDCPDQPALPSK